MGLEEKLKYLKNTSYRTIAYVVIVFSMVFRMVISNYIEFGNDEVYYWLYAMYPDYSHFDHPPMVGYFIQIFTGNLYFDSELFVRLAAIIPSGLCMLVVYKIAANLKNEYAGLLSVLLYNCSIYGLVISGIFILPDAPLLLFWLLGFYFFLKCLPYAPKEVDKKNILLGFLFSGLAIYSKYQGVYLLLGVGLYVLFLNRLWLKEIRFYLGFLFPMTAVLLIFYWNYQNDFISFSFHNDRVSLIGFHFNKDSFFRELSGQILYNNPYYIVLLLMTIVAYRKKIFIFEKRLFYFFMLNTLPLIITVFYLSLSRSTLPHWSGISYILLIPLVSVYLSSFKKYFKILLLISTGIVCILIFLLGVINKGWLMPLDKTEINRERGEGDFTLDMYGWRQASEKVIEFMKDNKHLDGLPFVVDKWYPGSHIHYYIAKPLEREVYGLGELKDIHKYHWINKELKEMPNTVLYITDSRNFKNPKLIYKDRFHTVFLEKEIPILRGGKVVKYVFIYRLKGY